MWTFHFGRLCFAGMFAFLLIAVAGRGEAVEGPDEKNVARLAADEYVNARKQFFQQQRTAAERDAFYTAWRDRLLAAAEQVPGTQDACHALTLAAPISNTLQDYPTSITIVEKILDTCPDSDAEWLVELGEVSRSAWLRTRNPAYGRKSIDVFVAALNGNKLDDDFRILVSGWLAEAADDEYATVHDLQQAIRFVEEAIAIFDRGHEPKGRLAGPGFELSWFVERAAKLTIWQGKYEAALKWLERSEDLDARPLPPGGTVLVADRSPKFQLTDQKDLERYVAFLDAWLANAPDDPAAIKVRMIAPRRYLERDQLEPAKKRLEKLVGRHQAQLEASNDLNHLKSEIWTSLRIIYSRLGDEARAKQAAEKAIAAKQQTGQPARGEEIFLEDLKRQAEFRTRKSPDQ